MNKAAWRKVIKKTVRGERICKAMKRNEETDRQGRESERRPRVVKKVARVPSSLSVPGMEGDSTQLGRHSHKHTRMHSHYCEACNPEGKRKG